MQRVLEHLDTLIAADTRNPPRHLDLETPVFEYLTQTLSGFRIQLWDYGQGSLALLAVRGSPSTLFNFHLDTVPTTGQWTRDPFALEIHDGKAFGLGSCDIKGALACMLAAMGTTSGDAAILVTTDEEAGNNTCINSYLAQQPQFEQVVVAEPTRCQVVTTHRGIVNAEFCFTGMPGHGSSPRALSENAIHRAMVWGTKALAQVQDWNEEQYENLKGVRFNIGTIHGGIKPNMIAPDVTLKLGLRTLPGQAGTSLVDKLLSLADPSHIQNHSITLELPSLPGTNPRQQEMNHQLAEKLGAPLSPAVDFWTEAALFSQAGIATVVLGSGDIAQAHVADEWVDLNQLSELTKIYQGLINHGLQ